MQLARLLDTTAAPFRLGPPLSLLLEAYDDAERYGRSHWEFAVEFKDLEQAGLTRSDFRRLVCSGYIERAVEQKPKQMHRCFQRVGHLAILENTCAVLSNEGLSWARQLTATSARGRVDQRVPLDTIHLATSPTWDGRRLQLLVGNSLVRQFKRQAFSQIAILEAFARLDWPPHLHDPLPKQCGNSAKRRLHETITNLNRGQSPLRVKFRGDGSGRGICWQIVGICSGSRSQISTNPS